MSKTLSCEAFHTKIDTLKGAKVFQIIFQGNHPKEAE